MNAFSYIKNVGKSFGYVAVDVTKELNPTITAMIKTNKDVAEDLFEAVKDIKGTSMSAANKISKNEYWELAGEYKKNLFSDLKSGKWYNKDRKDAFDDEMMKSMGFDFDMDFDFDDMDFDDDSTEIELDSDWKQTKELESQMDSVAERASSAVSTATVQSADYIVSSTKHIAKANATLTTSLFNRTNASLSSINANISSLNVIIRPLNTHIQNSSLFYTKSTELQTKQVELLEKIVTNTTSNSPNQSARKGNSKSLSNIIDSDGAIDLSSYLDIVKGNIADMTSMVTGMGDMFKDENGNGVNMLKTFTTSPIETMISAAIKSAIPEATKELSKTFNDSLGGIFSTLLMKVNNMQYSSNPILSKIGEILGISNSMKKNIDTSRYEKGKVDFDGITRKSIVEVIPTYLSKILTAVSGQEESRYDFQKGKFVTIGSIQKDNDYIIHQAANSAGYDIKDEFNEYFKGATKELTNSFEQMLDKAINSSEVFNPRSDDFKSNFGLEGNNGDEIQEFLKYLMREDNNNKDGAGKSNLISQFNKSRLEGRESVSDRFRSLESDGTYIGNALYNGSTNNNLEKSPLNLVNIKDEKNNNIFFYLRGIYQFTEGTFLNGNNGGGSKKRNKKGKNNFNPRNLNDIPDNNEPIKEDEVIRELMPEAQFDEIFKALSNDKEFNHEIDKLFGDNKDNPYMYYSSLDPDKQDNLAREMIKQYAKYRKEIKNRKNKGSSVIDKMLESNSVGQKVKVMIDGMSDLMNKPAELVNGLLKKADSTLTDIIYGKEDGEDSKSFLDEILLKTKDLFQRMNDWLDERILTPLSDKVKELSDKIGTKLFGEKGEDGKRTGGYLSNVINKTKDNFKGVGNWVKDSYKNTFGKVFNGKKEESQAATGGVVTKTGMIAVSEGELVIPSEQNPFYNKATNKAKQIRNESDVVNRYFGSYAKGGTVGGNDDESWSDLLFEFAKRVMKKKVNEVKEEHSESKNKKDDKSDSSDDSDGPASQKEEKDSFTDKVKDKAEETAERVKEAADKATDKIFGTKEKPGFFSQCFDELKNAVKKTTDALFGPAAEEGKEEETKSVRSFLSKAMKEIGVPDNASGMITGGLVGGGLSLLTGGLISPLMGASLGAASGLIIKSKKVQEALFGTEDGKEGLLPKTVSDFVQKKLPKMAQFGFMGAMTSLLPFVPGGPVTGVILGSALGFATQSDTVQRFIFGGGDNWKEKKDNFTKELKNRLPKMGAGAIAGLVAGPFGIAGNIITGAAVGYASGSQTFQEKLFGTGKDGDEGLIGWIKSDIFGPIKSALDPIRTEFAVKMKSLSKSLSRMMYNMFKETLGIPLFKKIEEALIKPIKGIISKLTSPLKKIISAPFKAIGAVGNKLRRKQIRNGTATYMSAAERIKYRNEHKMGRDDSANMDEAIANADDDQLASIASRFDDVKNTQKSLQKDATKSLQGTTSKLLDQNLSIKHTGKIMKLVQKGKVDEALEYLRKNSAGMSTETINKLTDIINSGSQEFNEKKATLANGKQQEDQAYEDLSNSLGVNVNAKNIWKYQDLLKSEKTSRKKYEENKTDDDRANDRQVVIVTKFDKVINLLARIAHVNINDKGDIEEKTESTGDDNQNSSTQNTATTAAENIKHKVEDVLDKDGNKISYRTTEDGETVQQIKNNQGEFVDDTQDKDSRKALKKSEENRNANLKTAATVGLIGSATNSIKNVLGTIGGKDKKKSTLMDLLTGENGLVSKVKNMANFFTGGGKTISTFLSSGFGQVLTGLLGPALFATAISGALNDTMNKLTSNLGDNDPNNAKSGQMTEETTVTATDVNGNTVYLKTDEDGNPVKDDNGNYIGSGGETIAANDLKTFNSETSGKSFSTRLKENTARGILTNKSSVASKSFSKLGSAATKKLGSSKTITQLAAVAATSGTDNAILVQGTTAQLQEVISKWISKLKNIPLLGSHINTSTLESMGDELSEVAVKAVSSGGTKLKTLTSVLSKATGVLAIAAIAVDFVTGYQDAASTLGILAKSVKYGYEGPSTGQKILAGLLRSIKNLIPVIGTLIPDKTLINIFCKWIAPALGIDISELTESRDEAESKVEDYNEEHGTDYTVEDYNKQVLNNYTTTEKIKNKVSSIKMTIKEKGLGGAIKGGISNAGTAIGNAASTAKESVMGGLKSAGDTISDNIITPIKDKVKAGFDFIKTAQQDTVAMLEDKNSDLKDFFSFDKYDDEENPLNGVSKAVIMTTRITTVGVLLVKRVAGIIKDKLASIFNPVKNDIVGMAQDAGQRAKFVFNGDVSGLWQDEPNSATSFISPFVKFSHLTEKVLYTIPTGISWVIHKAAEKISTLLAPAKDDMIGIAQDANERTSFMTSGDISGLWQDETNSATSFLSPFVKFIHFTNKVLYTIPTGISWVGHKIGGWVTTKVSEVKTNVTNVTSDLSSLADLAADGSVSKVIAYKSTVQDGFLSGIMNAIFNIGKIILTITSVVKLIAKPIEKIVSTVKDGIVGVAEGAWDSFKSFITGGDSDTDDKTKANGSGSKLVGGSSFISQKSSTYSNTSYGSSTLAEDGCGPAAAAMAVNAAKGSNVVSMQDSVAYAKRNNYEQANGTSADYFGSYFNSNGVDSRYIDGSNIDDIKSSIAAGTPTVLLGSDSTNTSKDNSPFGPGNHYVVAKGFDGNGNVIIDDPELNSGNRKYSSNILSKVKLGVATGRGSRIRKGIRKIRSLVGGDSSNRQTIWAFLKSKGCTDEVAAGIIGNMMQESSCDPSAVEGNGVGHGLVQWSYGRCTAMMNAASAAGVSWENLDFQLSYFWNEFTSTESTWLSSCNTTYGGIEGYLKLTDVGEATKFFCSKFERAGTAMMNNRLKYASDAYSEFAGKSYSYNGSDYSSDSSSSSSTSTGTVWSQLSSAFGNALSGYYGSTLGSLFGFSSSSSDTSSSSSTSGYSSGTVGSSTGESLVNAMKSIQGKVAYSMSGARNPEQGSADCSSTVNWAYKKVLGTDIGNNTLAILQDSDTQIVDQSNIPTSGGTNGSGPDVSKLQPGDILLYSRPNGSYTAGRDYRVGHVEMYAGDNQTIGHGGPGYGPTIKDISKDAGRYIMAKRAISAGAGSGLIDVVGAGSKFSSNNYTSNHSNIIPFRKSNFSNNMNDSLIRMNAGYAASLVGGSTDSQNSTLIKLIQTIIELLTSVNSNTGKIETIATLLSKYFTAKEVSENDDNLSTSSSSNSGQPTTIINTNNSTSELDQATKDLVNYLNELASGQ